MNAERLIELFERVGEAEGAVPKLRRFVIELGVTGRLAGGRTGDRANLEHAGPHAPQLGREEADGGTGRGSLSLPVGWRWDELGNISTCLDAQRRPINMTEREQRIQGRQRSSLVPYYGATQQQGWIDDFLFDEELVLLGEDGVPFLDPLRTKAYAIRGKAWVNNHAHVFRAEHVTGAFLVHWLNVFDYTRRIAGATRAKLNLSKALTIPVPVPPRDEQKEIVARIAQLHSLCDQLEVASAKRERRRDRLVTASLQRLREPGEDEAEFREHAAFHLRHLGRMTTRVEHVRELREAVLAMAVRGGLNVHRPIARDSVRLGDVATLQNGYAFKSEWFGSRGVRLLRNINVTPHGIRWEEVARIDNERANDFERFALKAGDIVLSLDRPFIVAGTKVARIGPSDGRCLLLQRVGRFVLDRDRLEDDFLFLWLTSKTFSSQLNPGRSNGVPHISSREVEDTLIWLPSIQEQRATVRRASELLELCDQLERALLSDTRARVALLDNTIRSALAAEV